ncbi:MAG: pyridoxamine 5'-phosphate oxidase family protein [Desulfovermiculus sp.]|nr:pyridoxamine 5'-phosphate oxidase family protein [Desulfovermiculus sp.]
MNESAHIEKVRTLLESHYLGVLATSGPQGPHASLVAFASSFDVRTLVLATPMSTRKYANMLSDPRVALLADSRSNQSSDFHAAVAVTAYGQAHVGSTEKDLELMHLYLDKNPHLVDFVHAPSCALVSITVDRYSLVTSFQQVMEIFV